MQELVTTLNKRKRLAIYIVLLFALFALIVEYSFEISPLSYFEGKYNLYFANGLIVYKFIELLILYYILFHRYILKIHNEVYNNDKDFVKLKKHTALLFFLIPQGNTIFGIIAYKLTANVSYFILFALIAIITLILVKPEKLLIPKFTQA